MGKMTPNCEKLKQTHNVFYHLVCKVKREYWRKFLMGNEEIQKGDTTKTHPKVKNQCWKALQYTKPHHAGT